MAAEKKSLDARIIGSRGLLDLSSMIVIVSIIQTNLSPQGLAQPSDSEYATQQTG